MAARLPPSPVPMAVRPAYPRPPTRAAHLTTYAQQHPVAAVYTAITPVAVPHPAAAAAAVTAAAGSTTVCVSNLPDELTVREFRLMFKFSWGFERATINRTKTGHQVGYARFSTIRQAQSAMEYLQGFPLDEDFTALVKCFMSSTQLSDELLDNRAARTGVKRGFPAGGGAGFLNPMAKRRRGPINPLSIYIGGIPHDWTEAHLTQLFEPHGVITALQLAGGKVSEVGNIAFIFYSAPEEATAAIAAMNNYPLDGGKYLVVRHNTSMAGQQVQDGQGVEA